MLDAIWLQSYSFLSFSPSLLSMHFSSEKHSVNISRFLSTEFRSLIIDVLVFWYFLFSDCDEHWDGNHLLASFICSRKNIIWPLDDEYSIECDFSFELFSCCSLRIETNVVFDQTIVMIQKWKQKGSLVIVIFSLLVTIKSLRECVCTNKGWKPTPSVLFPSYHSHLSRYRCVCVCDGGLLTYRS